MRSPQLETICDFSDLQQLASPWHQLFAAVDSASPFQSPDWLVPWWKHFHPGELHSLALRDGDELVAMFPFYIEQKSTGLRQLKLIGCGNSDYLDPLIRPDYERQACEALAGWLSERCGRIHDCVLDRLTETSAITAAFPEQTRIIDSEPCLSRQLPPNKPDWRQSISPHLNYDLRQSWHRAQKRGTLRLQTATGDSVSEYLGIFFSLHNRRWVAKGRPGVAFDQTIESFLCDAARAFLQKDMLRLSVLWWNDRPVAAIYGFRDVRTFYMYLIGFDSQFASFSFGSVAIEAAVEAAIEEGCTSVDFLRGREGYKYRFGATERRMLMLSCPAAALQLHYTQST